MLRRLWTAYERQLGANPVRTQSATSTVLWGAGDWISQRIAHNEDQHYGSSGSSSGGSGDGSSSSGGGGGGGGSSSSKTSSGSAAAATTATAIAPAPAREFALDTRRWLLTCGFGAAFVGPVGEHFYKALDAACRRLVPGGGLRFLATKVVLDSATMGSAYVAAFFCFSSLLVERAGWEGFVKKMRVDFVPTYLAELSFWPAVQAANFRFVPVRHQLLVVNGFSLFEASFLCWVGAQSGWYEKVAGRLGLT